MSAVEKTGCLNSFVETTKRVMGDDRTTLVASSIFGFLGAAFLVWGVVHFVPQWTQAFSHQSTVSYMTPAQVALNPYAMAALVGGGAITMIGFCQVVSLIFKRSEPNQAQERRKQLQSLAVGVVALSLAVALIAASAVIYTQITGARLQALPFGATIIATSQQKLIALLCLGSIGGGLAGVGITGMGHYLKHYFRAKHTPQVPPYPPYEGL
ncbi:hypothetical protein ACFLR2_00755 [Chlamydiota bacterium]